MICHPITPSPTFGHCSWTIANAKKDVASGAGKIVPFIYKPFDKRYFYYSGRTKGFVAYPRRNVMQHMVSHDNFALIINRQTARDYFSFVGITDTACNHGTFYLGNRGQDYCLPLYLYPAGYEPDKSRRVNFDDTLWGQLKSKVNHPDYGTPNEIETFDYIYGVLHCPAYRETYAEFLKIDFPRIPWPKTPDEFWSVSDKGTHVNRGAILDHRNGRIF